MISKKLSVNGVRLTALLALALVTYSPGLSGDFLFDDYPNLLLDDSWKVTSSDWKDWLNALGHGISSPLGRPLALLSFSINYYFTGLSPLYFKLGNIALHLINGLLVWMLVRRLINSPTSAAKHTNQSHPWVPLLLAAAWLVHPLQVSTVLYVVQRMEIGATTGILLALLCYVTARRRQTSDLRSAPWFFLAAIATAMGLGFKETAIIAPLLALLIEATIFRFRNAQGGAHKPLIGAFLIGALITALGYIRVIMPFVTSPEETLYAIRSFNSWERMLSQGPALALYLKQILVPLPEAMTFYYDNFPVSRSPLQPATTLFSFLLLGALGLAAILCYWRWPLTFLGITWFFACHALTSNVIPLELVFEHRNYLALFGVLLALVQPLTALGARLSSSVRIILGILPVTGLAVLCMIQSATWGDPLRLAWTLENRNPDSSRASYALGRALLEHSDDDPESQTTGMIRDLFRHAASLPEASPLAAQGLILLDARHARPVEPEVWDHFRSALTRTLLGPEGLSALYAVSNCRIRGKCQLDDNQLLGTFLKVLEHNPESGAAHTLYANFTWNVTHDRSLAIRMQREAVRLSATNYGYSIALAKFLLASEDAADRNEGITILTRLESSDDASSYRDEIKELQLLRDQLQGESAPAATAS